MGDRHHHHPASSATQTTGPGLAEGFSCSSRKPGNTGRPRIEVPQFLAATNSLRNDLTDADCGRFDNAIPNARWSKAPSLPLFLLAVRSVESVHSVAAAVP